MSFGELIFLAVLALLVFGPRKLPEIARQVAKVMAELRKASNEFRYQLEDELHNIEATEARQKRLEPTTPDPVNGTVSRSGDEAAAGAGATGAAGEMTYGAALPPAGEMEISGATAVPWDEAGSDSAEAGSWEAAVYERDLIQEPAPAEIESPATTAGTDRQPSAGDEASEPVSAAKPAASIDPQGHQEDVPER